MHDTEMIKYSRHDEIHQILHVSRVMIKTRIGRQNDSATARKLQHVFEVNGGKRRFARNKDKFAILLEHHVG